MVRLLGAGTFNAAKLMGVTKLDVVRSQAFIGAIAGADPSSVHIPVVGGHAGVTILPLLSQVCITSLDLNKLMILVFANWKFVKASKAQS